MIMANTSHEGDSSEPCEGLVSFQKETEPQSQEIVDLQQKLNDKAAVISKLKESLDMVMNMTDKEYKQHQECGKLRGLLDELKHVEDDEDAKILKKIDALQKGLSEKEESLEDLDALNHCLISVERKNFDELQEARNELINDDIMEKKSKYVRIGVKRMGEIDTRPFLEAMKERYNEEEAAVRASELSSMWADYLKTPIGIHSKLSQLKGRKEIIDDDDES
uniref:Factor of DNA methylation 1-5/IDN2 domain-containing protein n=1 Tax=Lotus japonicus TaxID=34305 RepID=I3T055_LOTJA|nr:unknown [Lotus japonicus]